MFYKEEDLIKIGFKSIGKNVLISDKASIYGAERISIGNDVRIDDFCVISAGKDGISIGNNVHIAVYVSIIGNGEIIIEDFVGISSKTAVYSSNDDYSGNALTGPTLSSKYTNVSSAKVHFKKHVIVGAGSIVLPGVTIGEGTAIGALSLINKSYGDFLIVVGNPSKILKERSKKILEIEQQFYKDKL